MKKLFLILLFWGWFSSGMDWAYGPPADGYYDIFCFDYPPYGYFCY